MMDAETNAASGKRSKGLTCRIIIACSVVFGLTELRYGAVVGVIGGQLANCSTSAEVGEYLAKQFPGWSCPPTEGGGKKSKEERNPYVSVGDFNEDGGEDTCVVLTKGEKWDIVCLVSDKRNGFTRVQLMGEADIRER